MESVEVKTFSYDELTEEQQEKVLEEHRYINTEGGWWHEYLTDGHGEFFGKELREIGIEYEQIYFDLGRGSYLYLDGGYIFNDRLFLKHAGYDLRKAESRAFIDSGLCIASYHRSYGYTKNLIKCEYTEIAELTKVLNDKLNEFLVQLHKEYQYATDDEAVIETIRANEFRFSIGRNDFIEINI